MLLLLPLFLQLGRLLLSLRSYLLHVLILSHLDLLSSLSPRLHLLLHILLSLLIDRLRVLPLRLGCSRSLLCLRLRAFSSTSAS